MYLNSINLNSGYMNNLKDYNQNNLNMNDHQNQFY
jgi:hypothetical protein